MKGLNAMYFWHYESSNTLAVSAGGGGGGGVYSGTPCFIRGASAPLLSLPLRGKTKDSGNIIIGQTCCKILICCDSILSSIDSKI